MATTLWYDKTQPNRRDKIIATGQFTMCYNLMAYLADVKDVPMTPGHKAALEALKAQLVADWQLFQTNPLWLVNHST